MVSILGNATVIHTYMETLDNPASFTTHLDKHDHFVGQSGAINVVNRQAFPIL